jgi:tetratricopeptide (TPR) repeat protein
MTIAALDWEFRRALACWRDGRYDEGIDLLTTLLSRDPAHAEAHLWRGRMFALTGQAQRAMDEFEQVLRVDGPAHREALLGMAGLCLLLGLHSNAEVYLRLVLIYSA